MNLLTQMDLDKMYDAHEKCDHMLQEIDDQESLSKMLITQNAALSVFWYSAKYDIPALLEEIGYLRHVIKDNDETELNRVREAL
jgi:hypothetical protein